MSIQMKNFINCFCLVIVTTGGFLFYLCGGKFLPPMFVKKHNYFTKGLQFFVKVIFLPPSPPIKNTH